MALHFREATRVYRKTAPFVLLQLGIGVLFGLLGVIYLGFVLWLAYRFLAGDGGMSLLVVGGVMVLGLLSFAWIWRMVKRYVLYMVNAGHIAVIAHVVEEDEVPENQLRYGFERVKDNFESSSALWGLDELIDGVITQLTRATARIQDLIPVPVPPNVQTLFKLINKSIMMAVNYVDEAILAYIFVDDSDNNWRSGRDGVVLYAKTWKTVLGSTVAIVFGMWALSFVLLTLLAPAAVVLDFLPTTMELLSWVMVGGMVAVVHTGVVKPWVKTVVITTFLLERRDHVPDGETMDWVEQRSEKFTELRQRAEDEDLASESDPTGQRADVPGKAA